MKLTVKPQSTWLGLDQLELRHRKLGSKLAGNAREQSAVKSPQSILRDLCTEKLRRN